MKIENISFIVVSDPNKFKKGGIVQIVFENGKKEFKRVSSILPDDNVVALTSVSTLQSFKCHLKKIFSPFIKLKNRYYKKQKKL